MFDWIKKLFTKKKQRGITMRYWPPLGRKCPNCGKKGKRTYLIHKTITYDCQNCNTWWVKNKLLK